MEYRFRCDAETALVRTNCGLVKGYEHNGLLIFKGIPYAQARRFHAPEPVKAWDGVFDASNYGFVCPDHRLIEANIRIMGPVMAKMMQQMSENAQH